MKVIVYLLSFVVCSFAVLTQAAEPVPVQIKSVRKCEATVEQTDGAYIVDVKMASIHCFKPAMNKSLSLRKANNMALVALLKYLNPDKKNASLSCSGMETIKTEFSEKVCRVVCRIPQNGVKIIDAPVVTNQAPKKKADASTAVSQTETKANSRPKIVSSKSSLLTRQADYEETIDELANILLQEAPQCVDSAERLGSFIKAIADFEEQVKSQFAELKKTIEQERELLKLEKSELLETLAQSQNKPMQRLKTLAKCAQAIEAIDKQAKAFLRSIPECPVCSEELDSFYEKVADCEEKIVNQFTQLKKTIEQEREFLPTDKSKLQSIITQCQNKPMQRLKTLAKCAQELETLKDFESEPEYAEYLLSNPFYRENGGVKVYRSSTGYGLISLGSAFISQKNKAKPAILLRNAKRVAELRARAELAGELENKDVETKETYTEAVKTKIEGAKEELVLSIDDYSQIIKESASAFLENVRPVASWRSADGEKVYVVLGMFREKK